MGTFEAVLSTSALALAAPQYPFPPAGGPRRTWPSGQRGVGAAAGAGGRFAGGANTRLPAEAH